MRDSGLGNVFDFFDIKKVGIVLRPNSPELKSFFLEIKEAFELQNIEVLLELNSAHTIKYQKGVSFNKICKEADLFISVGGDGTLISVSRRCTQKPVLGVNLGNLGFLTELSKDEFLQILKKEKKVDFKIENRMLMQAEIGLGKFIAFNDIVITKKTVSSMINIKAKVNSMEFNNYYGDGLIISTPNGSSAYNLSCGGPLVYPNTQAFIVTPISPHSLTQRPIVLPADFEIELYTPDSVGGVVIIDGQDIYEISQNEVITIKISNKKAQLLYKSDRNYFANLSQKMKWGEYIDK